MSTNVNDDGREVDLLVIGSGGGGLVATLTALSRGYTPLLVEKTDLIGGSTALSGGQLWLPGNHYLTDQGVDDSPEKGYEYLEDVVGDAGPGASPARKRAFAYGGLEMLDFLEREGLRFMFSPSPDDYPEAKHGTTSGRAIEATLTKRSALGDWGPLLRSDVLLPLPVHMFETLPATLALRSPRNFLRMCGLIGRAVRMKVTKEEYLTLGQALVAQLMLALQRRGAEIWLQAAMTELIVEDGRVTGAVIERAGARTEVRSRNGVLLTTGGYGRNAEMRRREQAAPIDGSWSTTAPGDTGDGIRVAVELGAETVNLDESIWCPCPILDGKPMLGIWDRSLPHTIMVDQSGERYVNESLPYMELGQRMLARHQTVPAAPSWMILDSTHRHRYPLVGAPPGLTPRAWLKSGFVKKASTIDELARECGIDAATLQRTVARFNSFAVTGRDEDFGRGESSYDRFFADETQRPNPCLGALESGPFYAVQVFVADVATVGGVATDAHARVLREDGSVIDGLYSAGVGAGTITGRIYPAPGASIANTMVFGYVAAEHALAGDRAAVVA
jgi:3-oxosteroid 1-dehydrogenase